MGFLYKNKANVKDARNPYYFGNGCFNFPGLHENFSLRIIDEFKLKGYSSLYECNLCYNYNESDSFIAGQNLCYKLVIGFDKDKMINDSKYTRFVFDRIINGKNLRKIHDYNYDFIDASKHINYIGSVIEINGNLVFCDDDNIRNTVKFYSQSKSNMYPKSAFYIDKEKRERAYQSSINRQARIDCLKIEKERLTSQYKDYQKNKIK